MFGCQDQNGRFGYWTSGYARAVPEELKGYSERFATVVETLRLIVPRLRTEKILSTHRIKGGTLHTVLTKSGEVQLDEGTIIPCGKIPAFGIKKYKLLNDRQFKMREKEIAKLEKRLIRVNRILQD
jgi:hypothetical protein